MTKRVNVVCMSIVSTAWLKLYEYMKRYGYWMRNIECGKCMCTGIMYAVIKCNKCMNILYYMLK